MLFKEAVRRVTDLTHFKCVPVVLFLGASLIVGCRGKPAESPSEETVALTATSPKAVAASHLGRPLGLNFEPLRGKEGATLFPKATPPEKVLLNELKHEVIYFNDTESLSASAAGWGISAETRLANGSHHASHRAYQLEYALLLDDTTRMRKAPDDAFYYASKVYYGHSYELVLHGSSSSIYAALDAQLLVVSAGLEAETERTNSEFSVVGRGLVPKSGDAIFLRTDDEIREKYSTEGPAVPILIEYKRIPGRNVHSKSISWPRELKVTLSLDDIHIIEDGTAGETPWTVRISCSANGVPLKVDDPTIFEDTIDSGDKRELNWSQPFTVREGDVITCETTGTFTAFWTGTRILKTGTIRLPIESESGRVKPRNTTLRVTGGTAQYEIGYSLRAGSQVSGIH